MQQKAAAFMVVLMASSLYGRLTFDNRTKKTIDVIIEQRGAAPDFIEWKSQIPIPAHAFHDVLFNENSYLHQITIYDKTVISFTVPSIQYANILKDPAYHLIVPITLQDDTIQLQFPATLEALIKHLDVRTVIPKSVKEQTIPDITGQARVRLEKDVQQLAQEEHKKASDYVKCPPAKNIREIVADYLINETE